MFFNKITPEEIISKEVLLKKKLSSSVSRGYGALKKNVTLVGNDKEHETIMKSSFYFVENTYFIENTALNFYSRLHP